ncbi:MAG TPA: flippase [Verrucomicrobiae bacterium]|nr:flippase [Verrucomicrobiae bacterium]
MSEGAVQMPQVSAVDDQQFRSQVGHITRHSGVFFAGTVFSAAFGYIFKVYLARALGAEALGVYALGMTLVGFLSIFNTLGLPGSAVRFVASYQAAGRFKELHALIWRGAALLLAANLFFAAVLLSLGRVFAVRFYHLPGLVRYLPWFALLMLFSVVGGFYSKVLAGYRDLKWRTLIVNFIGSPLTMLLAVLLIWLGLGLRGYLMAQILSAAVAALLLVVVVQRFTPPAARLSAMPGSYPEREVWSFSAAVLGIGFLEFIMSQVDKVALGYYWSPRDVGIYSVAAALVVYVPVVLSSVNQIFAPTIAHLYTKGDRVLLSRLFQSLTKWVIGLTLPLAVAIIVFARPLMRIFGHDFESGWPILIIGTCGQLVNCGVGSVGYLLLMSGNERRLVKVQATMAALMVVLTAALVPVWGIVGAAIAAAVTNVGTNVWNLLLVRKVLRLSPYNRGYLRLLPGAAATVIVALVAREASGIFHHDWIMVGAGTAMAYLIFAGATLAIGLDQDDRMIASAIWAKVRSAVGIHSGVSA